ncbi:MULTISPECIES: alpha/beta fold hydrolase [Alphaproteobacteria]|uniref:Serine aminopeptidase S33 domain-containing protein n=2 Tax=Alphaproteobacteria TaxID=28211 RepID=A0A512HIP4_9HYPH|nr:MULTISPECIES: alpha/beta fold hydrolase [Alphaproteobacteria]GEO85260.1 hypothetical protein RNA01_21920 [Ciceribacter naphthalenivorans]GLR20899.1 hypothetical protein GCM10007920_06840 [Ciceribacter naphthalenivorans]GLT03755.1 hypothetical protein GCM10007926_06840 [Sphingomonas psychrolutea]
MFDGLAGMYHAAPGSTAVLLISPWGYEELCARQSYRLIGEHLASLGYPCLRFDLPGTCHSAGSSGEIQDEWAWRKATETALDYLTSLCAPREVIVIGQGLGGLIAADLTQRRSVSGLVLFGSATQGRIYLREVTAWTAMTQPTFLVRSSDGPQGGLMAGGFMLAAATVNEIKGLKLLDGPLPKAHRVLLVERPENPGDVKLAEHLASSGAALDRIPFQGYVDYISSPTLSQPPLDTIDELAAWLTEHFPPNPSTMPSAKPAPAPAILETANWREELFRFGPGNMFFGGCTSPVGRTSKTALLVLNAGNDHSSGWGRCTVDLAREVAPKGLSVLRMDLAGIGETPLWPGQQEPVLYSTRALNDVRCAIDWLKSEMKIEHIIVMGRCSGAYLAFSFAALDERVDGTVLINPRKLVWDPREDVDQAIREPIQSLETYGSKLTDPNQFKRLLSGDLPISRVLGRLTKALASTADRKLARVPVLRNLSNHYRLSRIVRSRLETLSRRHAPIAFIYSEGDRGLSDFHSFVGDAAARSSYPNASFSLLKDADHNLSPLPARAEVTRKLLEFAARIDSTIA